MKFIFYCVIILYCLCFHSCSNELKLNADSKDIPVVYGVMSAQETDQYIRLEKVFIDDVLAPEILAQDPNALYYENAIVRIIRDQNGRSIEFNRIDASKEGKFRDDGFFLNAPNFVYKAQLPLNFLFENESYTLEIIRSEELPIVTANTVIPDQPLITRPSSGSLLDFDYISDFVIKWAGEAEINNVVLHINYREENINNPGILTNKTSVWIAGSNLKEKELRRKGIDFYTFLVDDLEINNSLIRYFQHIDVVVESTGQELIDYIRTGQANLGLTSSQEIPLYSNLSEGVGLFTSKNSFTRFAVNITPQSSDSLKNGQITAPLNFQ